MNDKDRAFTARFNGSVGGWYRDVMDNLVTSLVKMKPGDSISILDAVVVSRSAFGGNIDDSIFEVKLLGAEATAAAHAVPYLVAGTIHSEIMRRSSEKLPDCDYKAFEASYETLDGFGMDLRESPHASMYYVLKTRAALHRR